MSIYRKAAERIASGESDFACTAISCLSESRERPTPKSLYFAEYFRPEDIPINKSWFGKWYDEENRLARSLALLFMVEIEKGQK